MNLIIIAARLQRFLEDCMFSVHSQLARLFHSERFADLAHWHLDNSLQITRLLHQLGK